MFSTQQKGDERTNVIDAHQTKELNRLITKNRRNRLVIHNLTHKKCKFCSSSFSSTECRNCCFPIFQELNKTETKKILKNTIYISRQNFDYWQLKKYNTNFVNNFGFDLVEPYIVDTTNQSRSSSSFSKAVKSRSFSSSKLTASQSLQTVLLYDLEAPETLTINKMILDEPIFNSRQINSSNNTSYDGNSDITNGRVTPSAPSLGLVLFNNESESDLKLIVGLDKNTSKKFSGHRDILKNASPYFNRLINDCMINNNDREIKINWCDPKIFYSILKFVYTGEKTHESVPMVLDLFKASNRFELTSLSKSCLLYLYSNCSTENVLEILSFFDNYFKILNYEKQEESFANLLELLVDLLRKLMNRCLNVVDCNAQQIISTEEFLNMNRDLIEKILIRDTLNIESEMEIYEAVCRWAIRKCQQEQKELTDENKRLQLDSLIYCPRYLIMKKEEFLKKPYIQNILNSQEKEVLLEQFNTFNIENSKLPKQMIQYRVCFPRYWNKSMELLSNKEELIFDDYSKDDEEENEKSTIDEKQLFDQKLSNNKKKKSVSKRIIKGIGDVMILIIKVLD